jgi:hypothetical protein
MYRSIVVVEAEERWDRVGCGFRNAALPATCGMFRKENET